MILQDLLNTHPKLHRGANGQYVSLGLLNEVLSFINTQVCEDSKTLETGAGASTVLFAMKGTNHITIVPDKEEVADIKTFCAEHHIDTSKITFHVEPSEKSLPNLKLSSLDLVLIDGRHGFPAPFIDWYYTASALKIGGTLIIDDTHVWTGRILKEFLLAEPEWELVEDFAPRSVAFKKLKEGSHLKEWDQQAYTILNSANLSQVVSPIEISKIDIKKAQMHHAVELIRNGEFLTLIKKINKKIFG